MTVAKISRLDKEIAFQPSTPKAKASGSVMEAAVVPSTTLARISGLALEYIVSADSVISPIDAQPFGDSVWNSFVETTGSPNSGRNNLVIELKDNQTLTYNANNPWYGGWVYSALMACSSPNFIVFGGKWNWEYTNQAKDSAGNWLLTFLMRIGIVFFNANYERISEEIVNYGDPRNGTQAWKTAPQSSVQVPAEAAYFRFECVAMVSPTATQTSVSTGTGNDYARIKFDDVYAIQVINPGDVDGGGAGPTDPPSKAITSPIVVTGKFTYETGFTAGSTVTEEPRGNWIEWRWKGVTILWADGTATAVAPGYHLAAGLDPAKSYYFYPYYDFATGKIGWVSGGSGVSADGVYCNGKTVLNGWPANAHVGNYEGGTAQAHNTSPPITNNDVTQPYASSNAVFDGDPNTVSQSVFQHTHQYAGVVWGFDNPISPAVPSRLQLNILSDVPVNGDSGLVVTDRSASLFYLIGAIIASLTLDHPLTGETGHNTSANAAYNATNFAANFGTTTWVDQAGTTTTVNPAKTDTSFNPITPGHVSQKSVKSLIPNFAGKWYAHMTPWFKVGGGTGHKDIGVDCNNTIWVNKTLADIKARGFDGVTIDWYGTSTADFTFIDDVTKKIRVGCETLGLTFQIQIDSQAYATTTELKALLSYCNANYFQSTAYQKQSNKAFVSFFNDHDPVVDYAAAKTSIATQMYWMFEGASMASKAYSDAVSDWVHPFLAGVNGSDPHNLTATNAFLTSVHSITKGSMPCLAPGFNGFLTGSTAWSKGKYLPRDSGKCWLDIAGAINANVPTNCLGIQVATWNDWEEGSQVEGGIENDIVIAASRSGNILSFSASGGTGNESTLAGWRIIATPTADGVNCALIADNIAAGSGTHTFDLSTVIGWTAGAAYTVYVEAIGKGCIRNHISSGVAFTGPSGSTPTDTWNLIYDAQHRAKQWDSIILPGGTDPAQLQVMANNDSHDDMVHRVFEVQLDVLPPLGWTGAGYKTAFVAATVEQQQAQGKDLRVPLSVGAMSASTVAVTLQGGGTGGGGKVR